MLFQIIPQSYNLTLLLVAPRSLCLLAINVVSPSQSQTANKEEHKNVKVPSITKCRGWHPLLLEFTDCFLVLSFYLPLMAKSVNPGWHHKTCKQRQIVSQRVIPRALRHKSPLYKAAVVNSFRVCSSFKDSRQGSKLIYLISTTNSAAIPAISMQRVAPRLKS